MDTLVFASLMGLYYWFARLRLGYTFSAMLLQPVVIAVFVGLLLGNMQTAMIIGAGMQLVYLGVTSTPGGNVPSDPALAACIAIPFCREGRDGSNLAIALAIPFGVIGVFLDQLRRTLNAAWVWRINMRKRRIWRVLCAAPSSTRHCLGWYCASRWYLPPTISARTWWKVSSS